MFFKRSKKSGNNFRPSYIVENVLNLIDGHSVRTLVFNGYELI